LHTASNFQKRLEYFDTQTNSYVKYYVHSAFFTLFIYILQYRMKVFVNFILVYTGYQVFSQCHVKAPLE